MHRYIVRLVKRSRAESPEGSLPAFASSYGYICSFRVAPQSSTPRMRTVVGAGRRPRAGGEDSEFEDDLATCTREVTHRASITVMDPYCVHTVKLYYPD